MEELIPIIIFAVIILLKVVGKAAQGQKDAEGDSWDSDGGWTPASPTQSTPQPQPTKPKPTPSPRVQQILEQLQQQARQAAGEPATIRQLERPSQPAPQVVRAQHSKAKRVYLDDSDTPGPQVLSPSDPSPLAKARSPQELYSETLGKAFPPAARMARKATRRSDRRILLRVQGKQSLRKALLFSEVLGPPRAFDV